LFCVLEGDLVFGVDCFVFLKVILWVLFHGFVVEFWVAVFLVPCYHWILCLYGCLDALLILDDWNFVIWMFLRANDSADVLE
jgi:hypothetical protein